MASDNGFLCVGHIVFTVWKRFARIVEGDFVYSNVLIVGAEKGFSRTIEQRLKREGMNTYLVSPVTSKLEAPNPRHFHNDFSSSSMYDVMLCCNPDVVIFAEGFDPSHRWDKAANENERYLAYVSNLSNVVRFAKKANVSRFIYLSSDSVYADDTGLNLEEAVEPNSLEEDGTGFGMGEAISQGMKHFSKMQIISLRFDELYGVPADATECRDIVTSLCLQAVADKKMDVDKERVVAPVFERDAAEAVWKLVKAEKVNQNTYHISGPEISQEAIAEKIRETYDKQCEIVLEDDGKGNQKTLKDSFFSKEFGFSVLHSIEDTVPEIITYMKKHASRFIPEKEKGKTTQWIKDTGKIVIPYIEGILGWIVVMFLQTTIGQSEGASRIDIFLIYVLLFAVVHGFYLAVFTGMLSMVGFFYLLHLNDSLIAGISSVSTYVWISVLFILGMSVGFLHDEFVRISTEKEDEGEYLSGKIRELSDIATRTNQVKEYFEEQVINSSEGFDLFYSVLSRLDATEEDKVLFEAVQIFRDVMGSKHASVYTCGHNGYYRLLASTSEFVLNQGRSINMSQYLEVFEELKDGGIYTNRNKAEGYPDMACAISDRNNNIAVVLFIWNLPFEKMTLHWSNMLRILSMLTQNAIMRSLQILELSAPDNDGRFLSIDSYKKILDIYKDAERKGLVHFICLDVVAREDRAENDRAVEGKIRNSDFLVKIDNTHYEALLINAFEENVSQVIQRLVGAGFEVKIK